VAERSIPGPIRTVALHPPLPRLEGGVVLDDDDARVELVQRCIEDPPVVPIDVEDEKIGRRWDAGRVERSDDVVAANGGSQHVHLRASERLRSLRLAGIGLDPHAAPSGSDELASAVLAAVIGPISTNERSVIPIWLNSASMIPSSPFCE
jgi:hypothetical protein